MGAVEVPVECSCGAAVRLVPHFMQKAASSGSCVPHLGQYNVVSPLHNRALKGFSQLYHSETCIKFSYASTYKKLLAFAGPNVIG